MKRIAMKGKLIDAVESGTSPAGKDWANWQLQVRDKVFFCTGFDGVAANIKLIAINGEVECIGYFKNSGDEETRNLIVSKLNSKTIGLSKRDQCLKEYGSEEEIAKHREQTRLAMEKLGRVYTTELRDGKTIHRYEERSLCFERPDGTWCPKIELAMDILGPKFVSDELQKISSLQLNQVKTEPGLKTISWNLPVKEIREMIELLYGDALCSIQQ